MSVFNNNVFSAGSSKAKVVRDANGRCWRLSSKANLENFDLGENEEEGFVASKAFSCCDNCEQDFFDVVVQPNFDPDPEFEFSDPDESDPGGGDGDDGGGGDGDCLPDDDDTPDTDDGDDGLDALKYLHCDTNDILWVQPSANILTGGDVGAIGEEHTPVINIGGGCFYFDSEDTTDEMLVTEVDDESDTCSNCCDAAVVCDCCRDKMFVTLSGATVSVGECPIFGLCSPNDATDITDGAYVLDYVGTHPADGAMCRYSNEVCAQPGEEPFCVCVEAGVKAGFVEYVQVGCCGWNWYYYMTPDGITETSIECGGTGTYSGGVSKCGTDPVATITGWA